MSVDKKYLFLEAWLRYAPEMPEPESEYMLAKETGRKFKADFAFPDARVSVEVDGGGFAWGGGRHNTDEDRNKNNLAAALGWRVFHFSPQQLERNPRGCVALVKAALGCELSASDVPKPKKKDKEAEGKMNEIEVKFGSIEHRNHDGSRFVELSGNEISLSFARWLAVRGVKYTRTGDTVAIRASPRDAEDHVKNFAAMWLRRGKKIRWAWLDIDKMV